MIYIAPKSVKNQGAWTMIFYAR